MSSIGISATMEVVTLCVWDKDDVLLEKQEFKSYGIHAQLLNYIENMLHKYHISFKDIKDIVIDMGPASSFTGVRLSLAVVKSIGLLFPEIQFYETSSTQILYDEIMEKYPNYRDKKILVGYFGHQQRAYIQGFKGIKPITSITDITLEKLKEQILSKEYNILTGNIIKYLTQDVLEQTEILHFNMPDISYSKNKYKVNWNNLKPKYYRKTQAEENLL